MCGWVGLWRPGGRMPSVERFAAARDLMAARGPDDADSWIEGDVALGHRRLAVLDTTSAARQPMLRDDLVTVFNGEIYNVLQLRKELEEGGTIFRSSGDTEILPAGYRAWGADGLLARLDGMFSFCIWDPASRTFFAARDRVGKKPFFYSLARGNFTAGSDLKALCALFENRPEVETGILPLYLYHGFIPAPWTVYRHVFKLPPGSAMRVRQSAQGLTARVWSYAAPNYRDKVAINALEAEAELDRLLRAAVEKRLLADVPVGAFLSGGVDSSLVVAYAASAMPDIKCYAVGFPDAGYDERPFARKVARHLGVALREESLAVDALGELPAVVWNHGEPFADSSAVCTHAVAKMARQEVTVALTGDGGDEAFGGYPQIMAARRVAHYKQFLPLSIRRKMARLPESAAWPSNSWFRRGATFLRYGGVPKMHGYLDPDLWRDDLRRGLLTNEISAQSVCSPATWHLLLQTGVPAASEVDAALALDRMVRLPNDYLVKVDVATMACGLEARSPFLDTELLAFAASLPDSILLADNQGKGLLKRLAAKKVPRDVIYRQKAGFALPLAAWLRGPFRPALENTLLTKTFAERGHFSSAAVHRVVSEHMAGADHAARLWSLLVWETWCQIFLDRQPPQSLCEVAA